MVEPNKTDAPAAGFSPHIEELQEFFRSRDVAFGKPDDLTSFVERLSKDESFRDEMASMVRAIIYRERDGLTPVELMELLTRAVTGSSTEDLPEEVRDAERQMMGFAAGVFRSRWNPGSSVATEGKADAGVTDVTEEAPVATAKTASENSVADISSRPTTPIFYQAKVVANGGEEPELPSEPAVDKSVAKKSSAAKDQDVVLPLRRTDEAADDGPFLNLAGYAAPREPVVAFLRGEDRRRAEALPFEIEPQRSRGWAGVAIVVAVIVSFGAGMFARQLMLTRYGPGWPWHVPATWTFIHRSPPPVPVNPSAAQPSAGEPAGGNAGTGTEQRKPAQVEAASSEWKGGHESASDFSQPASGGAASAAGPDHDAAASSSGTSDGSTRQPKESAAKPAPAASDDDETGRVTAMVGASPGLMDSHLLFAPKPQYPEVARLAHVQGPVVVETLVDRDGSVARARAISGSQLLRGAAEEAVLGRRYRPYVVNDIPMAVRTLVTIDFKSR